MFLSSFRIFLSMSYRFLLGIFLDLHCSIIFSVCCISSSIFFISASASISLISSPLVALCSHSTERIPYICLSALLHHCTFASQRIYLLRILDAHIGVPDSSYQFLVLLLCSSLLFLSLWFILFHIYFNFFATRSYHVYLAFQ